MRLNAMGWVGVIVLALVVAPHLPMPALGVVMVMGLLVFAIVAAVKRRRWIR